MPAQNPGKREEWQETRYETGPQRGNVASCRYPYADARIGAGDRSSRIGEWGLVERRRLLQLKVALDEFAELFAVFIAHVYEFDAAAVGADVADHGGESDLAETGADLQLDRIADGEWSSTAPARQKRPLPA